MPVYRIVGDVLVAFGQRVPRSEYDAAASDQKSEAFIARTLGLKRFGAEEGIRIDSVEKVEENEYLVVGDVLRAFTVDLEGEDLDSMSDDELNPLVAKEIGLRRFGREEGIQIDFIEEDEP